MLEVPENIVAMELTRYRPSAAERTKVREVTQGDYLTKVREAVLGSQGRAIGPIPEPFDTPRYLVKFLIPRRKPILLKVYRDFIVTTKGTYVLIDRSLWTLLERKVSREKEAIEVPEKPCFHRTN